MKKQDYNHDHLNLHRNSSALKHGTHGITITIITAAVLLSSTVWLATPLSVTLPSAFAQSGKPLPGDDAGRDSLFDAKWGIPGQCDRCDPSRGKGPYHDNTLPGDDAGRDSLSGAKYPPHWPCDNRTLDPEWRTNISDCARARSG